MHENLDLIDIKKYFLVTRDDYGRIVCIERVGDELEFIRAVRKQNEIIESLYEENNVLRNELVQYKKSKQASYEAAQIEKNKAENKLRDIQAILNRR